MDGFGPQILNRAKTAGQQPLPGGGVGGLRIHVDQQVSFFYSDQVEFGLSFGIVKALTPDLCAGLKQLPAAPGVLYMAYFEAAADFHMGDKPIGARPENAGYHRIILHCDPTFLPIAYQIFSRLPSGILRRKL
jgi:hypothetical protein